MKRRQDIHPPQYPFITARKPAIEFYINRLKQMLLGGGSERDIEYLADGWLSTITGDIYTIHLK